MNHPLVTLVHLAALRTEGFRQKCIIWAKMLWWRWVQTYNTVRCFYLRRKIAWRIKKVRKMRKELRGGK